MLLNAVEFKIYEQNEENKQKNLALSTICDALLQLFTYITLR